MSYSEEERMQWIESLTVQNLMSFEDEEDTMLIWGKFYLSLFNAHPYLQSSTDEMNPNRIPSSV